MLRFLGGGHPVHRFFFPHYPPPGGVLSPGPALAPRVPAGGDPGLRRRHPRGQLHLAGGLQGRGVGAGREEPGRAVRVRRGRQDQDPLADSHLLRQAPQGGGLRRHRRRDQHRLPQEGQVPLPGAGEVRTQKENIPTGLLHINVTFFFLKVVAFVTFKFPSGYLE